jgi:hypothetical protein
MPPEQFKNFLIDHVMTNMSISRELADRVVNALLKGKKIVKDGDFAILETEDENGLDIRIYYRRVSNAWVIDTNDADKLVKTSDQTIFCDTKVECYQDKMDCDNFDIAELKIVEKDLKNMVKEFDLDDSNKNDKKYLAKVIEYLSPDDSQYKCHMDNKEEFVSN